MRRIKDLENRSKRNNIVIWGVEEGSEGAYTSMEEYVSVAIFQGLMNLEREVEVMRAHRTKIKQDANNPPKPRPIHVYLLRYTDRVFILKSAASKLKDNKYKNTQFTVHFRSSSSSIFIYTRNHISLHGLPRNRV